MKTVTFADQRLTIVPSFPGIKVMTSGSDNVLGHRLSVDREGRTIISPLLGEAVVIYPGNKLGLEPTVESPHPFRACVSVGRYSLHLTLYRGIAPRLEAKRELPLYAPQYR